MLRICHVSDLHIHRNPEKNGEALSLLARLARDHCFRPPAPNYLLITGDITDDGTEEQYARAQEALKPFQGRLLVCPGNHDYGDAGNIYRPSCARCFDEEFLPTLGIKGQFASKQPVVTRLSDGDATRVVLYGLNSILETGNIDDFARGAIGPAQLLALHQALDDPMDVGAVKLVYLHHRPLRCSWFLELVDSEDLMAVVHNRVHVLAFGHSGRMREPPDVRVMRLMPRRPYGVGYLLNANSSVDAGRYFEVIITGGDVTVALS